MTPRSGRCRSGGRGLCLLFFAWLRAARAFAVVADAIALAFAQAADRARRCRKQRRHALLHRGFELLGAVSSGRGAVSAGGRAHPSLLPPPLALQLTLRATGERALIGRQLCDTDGRQNHAPDDQRILEPIGATVGT